MGEVVVGLLDEPGFGGGAEDFKEADGHFWGDAAFSDDKLGESGARDAEAGVWPHKVAGTMVKYMLLLK